MFYLYIAMISTSTMEIIQTPEIREPMAWSMNYADCMETGEVIANKLEEVGEGQLLVMYDCKKFGGGQV